MLVSVITFSLSKRVPQDAVFAILESRGVKDITDEEYAKVYKSLNLHKPNFYFSILPHHYPDNLNATISYQDKKSLEENLSRKNFFFPSIRLHGLDNQYHYWLRSFFSGGYGISISDGQAVGPKVSKALTWTLSITIIDLVVSFFLGIYLGVIFTRHKDSKLTTAMTYMLYALYSIPVFWLATLLVVFFTTDDYGAWTNWFPSLGIDIYPGKSTMQVIWLNAHKLILPILCLTLHSLAYVSRYVQRSLEEELAKPYAELAYVKGLTTTDLIKSHILKNGLMSVTTIFISAAAAAFVGSLIIEVIFNIPGIGRLLYFSIASTDWNVVFFILMVLALVTSVVFIIGDILYTTLNPRFKLGHD